MCRVSFSTEHAKKKINWLQSKRLMPGTLVAISTKNDNFRSICMVATVAQRPYRDGLEKNPPEIDIVWANPDQSVIDPDMELIMIEARIGYYEAVRHTLVGLQMASDSEYVYHAPYAVSNMILSPTQIAFLQVRSGP